MIQLEHLTYSSNSPALSWPHIVGDDLSAPEVRTLALKHFSSNPDAIDLALTDPAREVRLLAGTFLANSLDNLHQGHGINAVIESLESRTAQVRVFFRDEDPRIDNPSDYCLERASENYRLGALLALQSIFARIDLSVTGSLASNIREAGLVERVEQSTQDLKLARAVNNNAPSLLPINTSGNSNLDNLFGMIEYGVVSAILLTPKRREQLFPKVICNPELMHSKARVRGILATTTIILSYIRDMPCTDKHLAARIKDLKRANFFSLD